MTKRKKLLLKIAIPVLSLAISSFFIPWLIIRAWIVPLPDSIQKQLDTAMKYDLDGAIVYVDQAGKEAAFYSAGWKNRENKVPADPQSLFKIASISKLYVAVATTKLVCSERLSLDDKLTDYFPELVGRIEHAGSISLRMMLQHRSGIPNLTDNPDFPWGDPPKSSREALEYALDQPAVFEPGARYKYSNTNYLLLSEIIDKTVGYGHQQYIKEVILEPLGLNNTYGSLADVNMDDVMSGYFIGWEPDLKENNHGNMLATAEDVGIFLRALNDGSLFQGEEASVYASIYTYEHTGLTPGYQSFAYYHEDIDAVVVMFVNTSGRYAWNVAEVVYNRVVKILRRHSAS